MAKSLNLKNLLKSKFVEILIFLEELECFFQEFLNILGLKYHLCWLCAEGAITILVFGVDVF
jgi:hypothetical protein